MRPAAVAAPRTPPAARTCRGRSCGDSVHAPSPVSANQVSPRTAGRASAKPFGPTPVSGCCPISWSVDAQRSSRWRAESAAFGEVPNTRAAVRGRSSALTVVAAPATATVAHHRGRRSRRRRAVSAVSATTTTAATSAARDADSSTVTIAATVPTAGTTRRVPDARASAARGRNSARPTTPTTPRSDALPRSDPGRSRSLARGRPPAASITASSAARVRPAAKAVAPMSRSVRVAPFLEGPGAPHSRAPRGTARAYAPRVTIPSYRGHRPRNWGRGAAPQSAVSPSTTIATATHHRHHRGIRYSDGTAQASTAAATRQSSFGKTHRSRPKGSKANGASAARIAASRSGRPGCHGAGGRVRPDATAAGRGARVTSGSAPGRSGAAARPRGTAGRQERRTPAWWPRP